MERRVTFKKVLGIIMLVCSSFIVFAALMIGPSITTITGFLLLFLSILYLVNPAIVYDDKEIQMKNLIGMTMKRYSFEKDKITTQDGRILVNGSRLMVARYMLVNSEYDDLTQHILNKQLATREDTGKPLMGDDEVLDSGI